MKQYLRLFLTVNLILLLLAACKPKATLDPNEQIRQAVASTLAALPTATPVPASSPYPSPTPFSLNGLFCEYRFCIGHPVDMAFFDVSAQQNPAAPSSYAQGLIASFNGNLFIQVIWQLAPGAADPEFVLDLILDDAADTRQGNLEVKLEHNMNVEYTAITSIATPVLPFGGAGAWVCGERAFGWKVYTPQAESAGPLFEDALSRFICI